MAYLGIFIPPTNNDTQRAVGDSDQLFPDDWYGLLNSSFVTTGAYNVYTKSTIQFVIDENNDLLSNLNSNTRNKAIQIFQEAYKNSMLVYMFDGQRSMSKQNKMYQRYQLDPFSEIMALPPGYSYHNYQRGLQMMVLNFNGVGERFTAIPDLVEIAVNSVGFSHRMGTGTDLHDFVNPTRPIEELQQESEAYQKWVDENGTSEFEQQMADDMQDYFADPPTPEDTEVLEEQTDQLQEYETDNQKKTRRNRVLLRIGIALVVITIGIFIAVRVRGRSTV